jgi:hypothetical protein
MADQQRIPYECPCDSCRLFPRDDLAHDHRAINRVVATLDERRRRLFVGLLASQHGHGGVVLLSRITGLSRTTIQRGLVELEQGATGSPDRVRQPGGGRRRAEKKPSPS